MLILKFSFELGGDIQEPSPVIDLPDIEIPEDPSDSGTAITPLRIETPRGEVMLNDPRELEDTVAMGAGIFSLTTLENLNPVSFGVIFNETNGSFAIGLEKEPIAQARLEAEVYMQIALGLSADDMCSLNIFVGVPYSINKFYSGQNLGLSFCPGSVSLE